MAADLILYESASPQLRELAVKPEKTGDETTLMFDLMGQVDALNRWRDEYNETCVLGQLGISYWRDFKHFINESMCIEGFQCLELLEFITSKLPPRPGAICGAVDLGTELYAAAEMNDQAIRNRETGYTVSETAWFYFKLGTLMQLLVRATTNPGGILVSL